MGSYETTLKKTYLFSYDYGYFSSKLRISYGMDKLIMDYGGIMGRKL